MSKSLRTTSMSWKILAAGVLVVVALCCAQALAAPRQPTGYFVIQKVGGQNVSDAKLSSPKWDGIVIRERWSAIEPTSTTSDWTFIDQQIARAKKYKKKYVLGINTGNNAPRWLGVPLYQEAPYPWDPTMLTAHGRMVKKLGERYADDPDLVGVHLSGPTRGPSGSLEMQLAVGLTSEKDYSEARVITAWQTCIDQYAQAFPDCALVSKGGVAPGGGKATITQAVFDYLYAKYPDRANVSHCALKAGTQEQALHHRVVVNMGRRGCRIGFEMVGPSVGGKNGQKGPLRRFGGSFAEALQMAERANAQWLTIYQGDERNVPD
jgi:hypothetical protein